MKLLRATGSALALAMLAACSGGSSASLTPVKTPGQTTNGPTTSGPTTSGTARVKATIILPRHKAKSGLKKRNYVSPNTEGLVIQVNQVVGGTSTAYSDIAYDLTQNSSLTQCSTVSAGTQCTIYFDAPPTSTTSTDTFYIYAYDAPPTTPGPIASPVSAYMPSGNLLSQDVGSAGTGDPVPSTSQSPANENNNSGIVANQDNLLTFVLLPVVYTPQVSLNSLQAAPLGTSSIVLSAPGSGSGGVSNTFAVDGYDYGDNQILAYTTAGIGDSLYVNPITVSANPGGSQFEVGTESQIKSLSTFTAVSTITDATQNMFVVQYTPASGDEPTSATSTVPSSTVSFSDSFAGGFNNTTTYGSGSPLTSSAEVAPLFAYVDPMVSSGTIGNSGNITALQFAIPSGATYSLTKDSATDCSAYTITKPKSLLTGDQQAVYTVAIGNDSTSDPNYSSSGGICILDLSDGISTDVITLTSTPTGSNASATIPSQYAQPVYEASGYVAPGTPFSFQARNAGDTLLCLESVYSGGIDTMTSSDTVYPLPSNSTEGNTGSYDSGDSIYGVNGYAIDASSAGDSLNGVGDSINGIEGTAYWCGEYANTGAANIVASFTNNGVGTATFTATSTPIGNNYAIVQVVDGFSNANTTGTFSVDSGFRENASVFPASEGENNPPTLFVESSSGLTQAPPDSTTQMLSFTPSGPGANLANTDSEGFIFVPIGPMPQSGNAVRRRAQTHRFTR